MTVHLANPELRVIGGKYALLRELGCGGTGTVYEAELLAVGKRVALKMLKTSAASDPEARTRFINEARATARVAHPNVVDVLDLGVAPDGTPYFVMELLEGKTLAEVVALRGPLPPHYACTIMLELLSGLAAAHRKGIVHCDLKPANVMLVTRTHVSQPMVKLLDFGLARSLGDLTRTTGETGASVMGTPMFMSPEQVVGQNLDERTDVYAATAILYVLLTGEDPFRGDSARVVMEQVARGEIRPVLEVRPTVPVTLAATVEQGMAFNRRERIGSVEELTELLREFMDPAPQSSLPAAQAGLALLSVAKQSYPVTEIRRIAKTPRLVTDSELIQPHFPRPPGQPKLRVGRDYMPLPCDPEHPRNVDVHAMPAGISSSEKTRNIGPAIFAMIVGFGAGAFAAWAAGLI